MLSHTGDLVNGGLERADSPCPVPQCRVSFTNRCPDSQTNDPTVCRQTDARLRHGASLSTQQTTIVRCHKPYNNTVCKYSSAMTLASRSMHLTGFRSYHPGLVLHNAAKSTGCMTRRSTSPNHTQLHGSWYDQIQDACMQYLEHALLHKRVPHTMHN